MVHLQHEAAETLALPEAGEEQLVDGDHREPGQCDLQRLVMEDRDAEQRQAEQDEVDRDAEHEHRLGRIGAGRGCGGGRRDAERENENCGKRRLQARRHPGCRSGRWSSVHQEIRSTGCCKTTGALGPSFCSSPTSQHAAARGARPGQYFGVTAASAPVFHASAMPATRSRAVHGPSVRRFRPAQDAGGDRARWSPTRKGRSASVRRRRPCR